VLRERLRDGMAAFGTCAGLILLSTHVVDGRPDQVSLEALDATVRRNAYGTQLASFEAALNIHILGGGAFPGVFIRAPVVESVGAGVDVLAEHEGHPVLVRSGRIWASTFHPELSGDLRVHERFLNEVMA
jgi:5'-phosphate synthase pdxT subunit